MTPVSIAQTRKPLLPLNEKSYWDAIIVSFNRSNAKTPFATTDKNVAIVKYLAGFNRSNAKTPFATLPVAALSISQQGFQSLKRENPFCHMAWITHGGILLLVSIAQTRKPLLPLLAHRRPTRFLQVSIAQTRKPLLPRLAEPGSQYDS